MKKKKRISSKEKIINNVFTQTPAWVNRMSIGLHTIILEKDASDYFVIIPCTFKPEIKKSFEVAIYSSEPTILEILGENGVLNDSDSESDSESDSDGESGGGSGDEAPAVQDLKGKGKEKVEKVEWSIKRRDDIAKRSSKHAPTEVTSKRPVTRKRQVVEVPKLIPRDPRFLPMTGEFSADKFQQSYSFLAENHKKELSALREALKQARKLLSSSPRDLRSEREHEVHRLEQAIKRAESLVNKDRLDQVQRDALGKIKKEEVAKRTQGKGEWHLKRGEVQKVVVQARYEALAKEGGQRAVKRAIEKKQKKESQKEKRSRPYAKGEFSAKDSDRPVKRRRV